MKLLRETVRKILLQEGMVTIDQLPDDVYIEIWAKGASTVIIRYMKEHPKSGYLVPPTQSDSAWGTIILRKGIHQKGLWEVTQSGAANGYGPLLYDIAMEYATEHGIGLVSDRHNVSDGKDGAQGVWNYYLQHRAGVDVEVHQMDDMENTLTPTPVDNIDQTISKKTSTPIDSWPNSALSKRYTKSPKLLSQYEDKKILYK
jgi:hypothetical protein